MVCHKTVLESLERLLLKCFLNKKGEDKVFDNLPNTSKEKLKQISTSPTKQSLEGGMNDEHILTYIDQYCQFRDDVRSGMLGKTAQFWMAYMDEVWLTLHLHEAVKKNDFLLDEECIHRMPDLFFSYDGQNYARYLTCFHQ